MKLLVKILGLLLCLSSFLLPSIAYTADYWKRMDSSSAVATRSGLSLMAKSDKGVTFWNNAEAMQDMLLDADGIDVEIPLPDGSFAVYHFEHSPVAEQALLDRYPQIRTFRGRDIDNPSNKGRFSISPLGFRGMFRHEGKTVFIDPQYIGDVNTHIVYFSGDAKPLSTSSYNEVLERNIPNFAQYLVHRVLPKGSSDGNSRTYRLAVAATGEYTAFFSVDTDPVATKRANAMAAIVVSINRVNEVFEDDMNIQLMLIGNNSDIVYVDASTDPYANDGSINDLSANQTNLDTVIGTANYDIGHLFSTSPGGLAALESVCDSTLKGRAVTGRETPTGDLFDITILSHEIGHQFGANHTFNGTAGACGGNRNASTAYEPGSGSTIMSYATICDVENLPDDDNFDSNEDSDPYFHAGSIQEMTNFITTGSTIGTSGGGPTCGVSVASVNAVPDAVAGPDLTIPANTPIFLSGSATDADGVGTLTYVWEQLDAGSASSSPAEWVDNGNRAIFRSVLPTSSPDRYLPSLVNLVDQNENSGESLPITNRDLNFRFTVRDTDGGTAFENKVLTVTTSAGPFDLLTPETDDVWTQGTTIVTWSVANTDIAPVNCSQVNIFYNGDITEGADVTTTSFNTVLATNAPNTGSALVTTPVTATTNARVLITCADNAFFSLSESNFEVSASADPIVSSVSDASANEGSNLTFTAVMSAVPAADETVNFEVSFVTAGASDVGTISFSSGITNNGDGTLTVPTGTTTFTATISTTDDSSDESDETFSLSIGSASATGTIVDDDASSGGGGPPITGGESPTSGSGTESGGGSGGSVGPFLLLLLLIGLALNFGSRFKLICSKR